MASESSQVGSSRLPSPPLSRENLRDAELYGLLSDNPGRGEGVKEEDSDNGSESGYEENGEDTLVHDEAAGRWKGADRTAKSTRAAAQGSTSWADLDLSIIVAFVSPIGNWLTGGDHIKNLFLIILLIFYLHQLIELPWKLYQSSLPRKSARFLAKSPANEADARLAALAHSELRKQEMFFLALTVVSPLIGALFLKHVIGALGGEQALSWFSTTLFVLATGFRPWSHLITRLRERTDALHDAIHHTAPDDVADAAVLRAQIARTLKRVTALEREVVVVRAHAIHAERLQGVCDDLSEAIGELERGTKRGERKADTARSALVVRVAALEMGLAQLEERRRKDVAALKAGVRIVPPHYQDFLGRVRKYFFAVVDMLVHAPQKFWSLGASDAELEKHAHANGDGPSPTIAKVAAAALRARADAKHATPRLATIPEAEHSDGDSDGTYVSDQERAPILLFDEQAKSKERRLRSRSRTMGKRSRMFAQRQWLFSCVQEILLWPYRASIRLVLIFFPPAEKVLHVA